MISAMLHETIWFDRPKYEEAEGHYQRFLAGTIPRPVSHVQEFSKKKPEESKPSKASSFSPVEEIAKARKKIQQTLSMAPATAASGGDQHIAQLEEENKKLKQVTEELRSALQKLTVRVERLEQGNSTQPTSQASAPQKKEEAAAQKDDDDDDDDDFDLFGSDDEDEDEEEDDKRKAALEAYATKKAKKPAVVAKSNIILDVKPWDDETDLKALESCVRSIECDGLLWGKSKFIPVAYGVQKLQICCVVEDEKVGTDLLEEKITEFEDYVQSVDVVAFNKI